MKMKNFKTFACLSVVFSALILIAVIIMFPHNTDGTHIPTTANTKTYNLGSEIYCSRGDSFYYNSYFYHGYIDNVIHIGHLSKEGYAGGMSDIELTFTGVGQKFTLNTKTFTIIDISNTSITLGWD